jgi:hypothetical protein
VQLKYIRILEPGASSGITLLRIWIWDSTKVTFMFCFRVQCHEFSSRGPRVDVRILLCGHGPSYCISEGKTCWSSDRKQTLQTGVSK